MKNKIVCMCLSAALLLLTVTSPVLADSRIEDAHKRVQLIIAGQEESERVLAAGRLIGKKPKLEASSFSVHNISGMSFINPTYGRLTSKFGWRDIGSGAEYHRGIDLANVTGTNIVASAGGVVTHSQVMGGYGNVVILRHKIDGQIYATVYAHLSSLGVSVGQEVTQGQSIGKMGNTGRSFGSHLHFEIHRGEFNGKRTNATNPAKFIAF